MKINAQSRFKEGTRDNLLDVDYIKITRNNFTRNKFKLIHTLNEVSHNVLKMKVDFSKVQ